MTDTAIYLALAAAVLVCVGIPFRGTKHNAVTALCNIICLVLLVIAIIMLSTGG